MTASRPNSGIWPIGAQYRKQPFIRYRRWQLSPAHEFVTLFAKLRRVQAFDHFGDYSTDPAFSAVHNLSVRAFDLYHDGIAKADESRPLCPTHGVTC
jgi:hypothetical protein